MDLISVIVPIYNVESYLERCVQSIQRQTYDNLEIILVDDGSTDSCPKMCDDFAKEDNRIKVIHKENNGQGCARNTGLKTASGKFVLFVDADDFIDNNHVKALYNLLVSNDADTVLGSLSYKKNHKPITRQSHNLKLGVYENERVKDEILLCFIGADINSKKDVLLEASACTNLYSKEIIDSFNVSFESERQTISEDLFFNLRYFFYAKKVVVENECGYYYCENNQSTTRKYDSKRFERTLKFYNKLTKYVNDMGLQQKVNQRVNRTFLLNVRFLVRLIVMSDLSKKQKKEEIKRVVDNLVVQNVAAQYPIETFSFAIKRFNLLLRKRNINAIYFLANSRQIAKNNKLLSGILKTIGIGKNK